MPSAAQAPSPAWGRASFGRRSPEPQSPTDSDDSDELGDLRGRNEALARQLAEARAELRRLREAAAGAGAGPASPRPAPLPSTPGSGRQHSAAASRGNGGGGVVYKAILSQIRSVHSEMSREVSSHVQQCDEMVASLGQARSRVATSMDAAASASGRAAAGPASAAPGGTPNSRPAYLLSPGGRAATPRGAAASAGPSPLGAAASLSLGGGREGDGASATPPQGGSAASVIRSLQTSYAGVAGTPTSAARTLPPGALNISCISPLSTSAATILSPTASASGGDPPATPPGWHAAENELLVRQIESLLATVSALRAEALRKDALLSQSERLLAGAGAF